MLPDILNGIFEAGLSFFLLKNIKIIRSDKQVKGVYWPLSFWTTAWGMWNLFYYPYLGQWFSFVGGLAVVTLNIIWIGHAIKYEVIDKLNTVANAR